MESLRIAVAVVFTVLPIVLLLGFFYTRDVRREPRALLVATFLLGTATPLAAVLFEGILWAVAGDSFGVVSGAAYGAFVVAAIPEELLKLLVIAGFCARRRSFDEPMDGIVYGATAALGFAAVENAMYVAQGGWLVAVLRCVTAVPMHAAEGAILGYSVARRKLLLRRGAVWAGLAIAILVHGLYDFGPLALVGAGADEQALAAIGPFWLAFLGLFLVVVAGTLIAVTRLVRRLRAQQLREPAPGSAAAPRRAAEEGDPLVAHLLERRAGGASPSEQVDRAGAGSQGDPDTPSPPGG